MEAVRAHVHTRAPPTCKYKWRLMWWSILDKGEGTVQRIEEKSMNIWMVLAFTLQLLAQGLGLMPQILNSEFSSHASRSAYQLSLQLCQKEPRTKVLLKFSDWSFTNDSILLELPIDSERKNYVRKVRDAIFSFVLPTPLTPPPKLVAVADGSLADLLDLEPCDCASSARFVDFVGGNWFHPYAIHLSHRYGGHQFGFWAGQLGDGRAVLLGEYLNRWGERWELQLKGSGRTPYSRGGDGRAVLRSSVREFLVSEAMHYLGVPTTRAIGLVVSEELAWRDQFYDGHPQQERTAVVLRIAPSWFRIGSLEILHYSEEYSLLKRLVDFIIDHHFPQITTVGPRRYAEFLATVVNETAAMIAQWQAVGFTHGVCNTDNFSLLSITMDYGPFGFMDSYDPNFIPNTSDDEGRYQFHNQPQVGFYNLQKLGEALSSLLERDREVVKAALYSYPVVFNEVYMELMRGKLGLVGKEEQDDDLVVQLLQLMEATRADYTATFRELSELILPHLASGSLSKTVWATPRLLLHPRWVHWVTLYVARVGSNHPVTSYAEGLRMQVMQTANPCYVLRNWMAEGAIQQAKRGDFSEIHRLYRVLKNPFECQAEGEAGGYSGPPPPWSHAIRVSCSS